MQLPVAVRARDMGFRVTIMGLTTAARDVIAAGIDHIGYDDLWAYAREGSRGYGETLCPDIDPSGPVSPAETIAYHGINFSELIAEVGETEARARFRSQGRHAFLPTNFMARVLQGLKPDIVVASNSPRSEQAAILAARQLSIPAVCLVDLFALQEYKWISKPGFADRICVLNDAVQQFFIAHGRIADELVVTGNPAFDSIILPETISAGLAIRRDRGWDDGRLNILWASQVEPLRHPFENVDGDPLLPRKIEEILREIVFEGSDMRLIVRYSPSENVDFVPATNVEFSPRSEPLHSLLHAVDLVIVTSSTVGLEAYIAGRSVISVDLSIFTTDAPFSSMGIATGVRTLNELRDCILHYVGDRQHRSRPDMLLSETQPPYATETVLKVIEDVASHL